VKISVVDNTQIILYCNKNHVRLLTGFIRADVINWQKLLDAGSYALAREKGLLRTEGKEYAVRDGDVIEFRI